MKANPNLTELWAKAQKLSEDSLRLHPFYRGTLEVTPKWDRGDLESLDPAEICAIKMDIDSVDFLNFAIGLHKELGIEIPDADVPKLATLNGCIAYLLSETGKS